jgi:hypothetical protein
LGGRVVQLKYFGDSRDHFKYDLITTILQSGILSNYVFIPMLTEHRDDNEGNITPHHRSENGEELREFILRCHEKSLHHWETWLKEKTKIKAYLTVGPVDGFFFADHYRDEYWKKFLPLLKKDHALIFVDPDTGVETGKPWYLRRMGREKYILNGELRLLIEGMSSSSVLMVYQHLPRNSLKHDEAVEKKIQQIYSVNNVVSVCAYREKDLAFMFICKSDELHKAIYVILKSFFRDSAIKPKSLLSLDKEVGRVSA